MLLCVTNNSKVVGLHANPYWQGCIFFVHVRPFYSWIIFLLTFCFCKIHLRYSQELFMWYFYRVLCFILLDIFTKQVMTTSLVMHPIQSVFSQNNLNYQWTDFCEISYLEFYSEFSEQNFCKCSEVILSITVILIVRFWLWSGPKTIVRMWHGSITCF